MFALALQADIESGGAKAVPIKSSTAAHEPAVGLLHLLDEHARPFSCVRDLECFTLLASATPKIRLRAVSIRVLTAPSIAGTRGTARHAPPLLICGGAVKHALGAAATGRLWMRVDSPRLRPTQPAAVRTN